MIWAYFRIATRPKNQVRAGDGGSTSQNDTVSTVAEGVPTGNDNTSSRAGQAGNTKSTAKSSDRSGEWSIFLSLSYVILTYLVLWSPFHVVFDILLIDENAVSFNWYTLASLSCYTNSAINPFLYAAGSKEFRAAFKKVLCCQCKK